MWFDHKNQSCQLVTHLLCEAVSCPCNGQLRLLLLHIIAHSYKPARPGNSTAITRDEHVACCVLWGLQPYMPQDKCTGSKVTQTCCYKRVSLLPASCIDCHASCAVFPAAAWNPLPRQRLEMPCSKNLGQLAKWHSDHCYTAGLYVPAARNDWHAAECGCMLDETCCMAMTAAER